MRFTYRIVGLALLALGLLVVSPAAAQDSQADMQKDIEALKQGQKAMQRQLNEIKALLQKQAKPTPAKRSAPKVEGVTFNLGDNEVKGDRKATLTLLEFTDYQ